MFDRLTEQRWVDEHKKKQEGKCSLRPHRVLSEIEVTRNELVEIGRGRDLGSYTRRWKASKPILKFGILSSLNGRMARRLIV